jgi:hypothetical protein
MIMVPGTGWWYCCPVSVVCDGELACDGQWIVSSYRMAHLATLLQYMALKSGSKVVYDIYK